MSKPAARQGDTTAHGGTIAVGCPTVLIGGKPAARMGDMHTCPMQTPGTPPIPHVGGPIILGSPTVLIGGTTAARVGDQCTCVGPPDVIAVGEFTVLIGESGGGSAGGGGGAGGGQASGQAEQGAAADTSREESREGEEEEHYLDVKVIDKGGKPITGCYYHLSGPGGIDESGAVTGRITRSLTQAGSCDIEIKAITRTDWSKRSARDGETVKLQIETAGIDDGAPAHIEVFERDTHHPDRKIEQLTDLAISAGKIEHDWHYEWQDEDEDETQQARGTQQYFNPSFYFTVRVDGCEARSNILEYADFIELNLRDDNDEPVANANYRVFLSSGEVREGQLDGNGYVKLENVPAGPWNVEFPDYGGLEETTQSDDSSGGSGTQSDESGGGSETQSETASGAGGTQSESEPAEEPQSDESQTATEDVWQYNQLTGELIRNGQVVGTGYSGSRSGGGLNNPAMENVRGVGPIPSGPWRIGSPYDHDRKGPVTMRLTPDGHAAHGRTGFLIHGDSLSNPGDASEGCIVLPRGIRETIANSGIDVLEVIGGGGTQSGGSGAGGDDTQSD